MSTVAALLAEKHSNKIKRQQDHYQGKKGQEEWDRREKALNDQRTFLKHFRDVQFPTYKERTRLEALGNQYFRPFVEYFHEGLLRKVFVKSGGWKKLQEIERSREECYGEIPTALSNMEILDDEEEMGGDSAEVPRSNLVPPVTADILPPPSDEEKDEGNLPPPSDEEGE